MKTNASASGVRYYTLKKSSKLNFTPRKTYCKFSVKRRERDPSKLDSHFSSHDTSPIVEQDVLFKNVVTHLPGIVFQLQKHISGDYVFNFISPAIAQLLQIPITSIKQIWSFIHPEDRAIWLQSVEKAYNEATPWKQELRFLMPDNTIYWWLGSASPSYTATGELLYNGILLNITRQKQAELTLKENQKKWRFALEGSGDGFWEYNVLTGETHYSSEFKQMLGYQQTDYVNEPNFWRSKIHPDDLEIIAKMDADYQTGITESHSIEYRTLNKYGSYVWIMDRGIVFAKNEQGKPVHFIGVHTNIDKQKRTELELNATATKLTTLITSIQDGILLEDESHNIVLCNQAACEIFDIPFSPRQLTGRNIEKVLKGHSSKATDFHKFMIGRHQLLKVCQPATNEEIELADGRWLMRDYAPLIIEGTCKGHLWKYTDITLRKKTKARLIEAEKRYRCLIENMQVGLVELDKAENIIYANQTFYNMCGYAKGELDGQMFKLVNEKSKALIQEKKNLRARGISDAYEIEIITKNGDKKWWYVSGAPRQNDNRETISTIGAFLDITPQKTIEQELRRAKLSAEEMSGAKDLFLANMSHEIRTPLNAVFGMSQLLEKTELLPQQRFYLETILNSASSLMHIVNDVLDFSKISVGKLSLERIGFKIKHIIADAVNTVAFRAQEKGLLLSIHNTECCNSVLLGDPFRLKQVFMNLLTNAVKFTNKGSVTVNWENRGLKDGKRNIFIQVQDTGRGMDEAFLQILFDKFTQEDESIARSYSGTGLGMSISKHLVELMGGTITVKSAKRVGTTFNLDLLFDEGTEEDLLKDEMEPANLADLKDKQILLVEDNEMNQLVAKTILEQNGMQVQVASNGIEAIQHVQCQPFDLILMDMQMPVMDGLMATKIIRGTHKSIPIVALTANALKGEQDKCTNAGMNDFLTKPFEEKLLLSVLCKWLCKAKETATSKDSIIEIGYNLADNKQVQLYNLDMVQAISPGNTTFLKSLLEMFINDAGGTVLKIKDAYEQKDYQSIKQLAHRIKPSIDQFHIPYQAQIRRMEELSLAEDTSGELGALITAFDNLMGQVTSSLQKEL